MGYTHATIQKIGTVGETGATGVAELPREWARHPSMGLPARAVLVLLASMESGAEVSARALADANPEWLNVYQAGRALDELERRGILHRGDREWSLVYPGFETEHPINVAAMNGATL